MLITNTINYKNWSFYDTLHSFFYLLTWLEVEKSLFNLNSLSLKYNPISKLESSVQ